MNVRKPIQSALKKTYIPKGFDFQKIFAGLPCHVALNVPSVA